MDTDTYHRRGFVPKETLLRTLRRAATDRTLGVPRVLAGTCGPRHLLRKENGIGLGRLFTGLV